MASVHDYKRLENRLVQKVKGVFLTAVGFIVDLLKALGRFLTRRYTIVFVPHSEKKVYNLYVTVLSLLCFFLIFFGVIGAFFFYGTAYNSNMYNMASKDGRLRDAQASLDQLRDETALLFREARNFENVLADVLSALGLSSRNNISQNTSGDLSSFLGIRETPDGLLQEVDDIRRLSAYLSQAAEPIREIGVLLDSQSALLTEIPSIWPVRGGLGQITMFFGQNIHPVTGLYYIHKGIDIATYRAGDPVVATADGQVVTVDYAYDFGNYVIIRHKHGYYTRYAHLQRASVSVGQRIQQGGLVGYIGSTGISTGPHLHYEVHIGSDVVDPYRYISIRSNIARQGR
ncbi:MAG: M23 family metallopeptidase [Treponema sp.]|jgi:murein DD-endopeptidase MepM/ murein hydrolase activator NlpD|nr:M23 family metallopeptidase [Treponema sp.]